MGLGIKVPRNALMKAAKDFKENPNGDNVELDPGTYLAVITGMKGVETSNGPQIILEMKIGGDVDEKIKGGKTALWFSFDEDRVIWLFRALAKLGYEVEDLDAKALDKIAEEIKDAGHVVRIKAKTSKDGDYVNVKLDKVMTDMDAKEVLAGEGDVGEDEEADEKPAKGKAKKKKDDEEEETEDEGEGEEDLDDLDRDALKAILKKEEIEFKVTKSTEDDEIREAIKEARSEKEEASEEEEEEKPAKGKKKKVEEEEEEEDEKPAKGKGKKKAEEEEEVPEEEEEKGDTVVKVGMKVKFRIKGELHKGKIVTVDQEEGKIVVKSDTDGKKYRLSPDKLED